MSAATSTRTMVLWCPDWPVTAAARAHGIAPDVPVALVDHGRLFACSAAARHKGVKRGLRLREAQARCPELCIFPYDPSLDNRSFEPVLTAIEEAMPGVQLLRPGTCAIAARGPSRYYGGEEEAALWLLDALEAQGVPGARIGIADGPFTAEHAARASGTVGMAATRMGVTRIQIVPEGESAAFLGPLPVGLLDAPQLTALLHRLGVRTFADFAALDADDVRGRFGEAGARVHALASGLDSRAVIPRSPPQELDSVIEFEPPLDRIDQVTFGFRASADRFIESLTRARLVCTAIRIEVGSESGEVSERSWLHPRSFTATDVVDRVRWQLQGGLTGSGQIGSGLNSGITRVRVLPESVDTIGNHEEGLWGTGPDERIHHGLSRVQSMLGHGGVLTAVIGGGRSLADRQNLVAWGDRPLLEHAPQQPWPGRLAPPLPTTVFPVPWPVHVFGANGDSARLDDRGVLSGAPVEFSPTGYDPKPVTAWAGPWPIDERWWDADQSRQASRFQLVDADGTAWLLLFEGGRWWAEARYD